MILKEKHYEKYFPDFTKNLVLIKFLYNLSVPFTKVFLHFNISPNTITTLSNISAILSFILLQYSIYYFIVFWILAMILDLCDGTVARITKRSSISGDFYDKLSDVLKVMILYLVIIFYYKSNFITLLVVLNIIAFSLLDYIDRIYNCTYKLYPTINIRVNRDILILRKFISVIKVTEVYKAIFIMHANFNLLFIPIFISEEFAKYTLTLILIVLLTGIYDLLKSLRIMQIEIDKKGQE